MNCVKCKAEIPDGSLFCNLCGKKQTVSSRKPNRKVRGNGMGCAYQRPGEKTWTVEVVVGHVYKDGDPSKKKIPKRKKKGGFPTKKAALEYAPILKGEKKQNVRMTLEEVYLAWKPSYEKRIDPSTMGCYVSAYRHFSALHGTYMEDITPEKLQACMDDCKAGKRTHQNMRTVAGLLWKYAVDISAADKNITQNLYTGKGRSVRREPLTQAEEETVRQAIGKERYAEYVFCMCYLGFRPGEFLELKKAHLFCADLAEKPEDGPNLVWYFKSGKKTDAGRDRIVVVPEVILPYVIERAYIPGTDLMFPMYRFSRPNKTQQNPLFLGFRQMTDAYFREDVFKPMMFRLGIAEGKVPYGMRHTYANKLKKAEGADRDKAELAGHSTYEFTKAAYQSSTLEDLKAIVDSFGK